MTFWPMLVSKQSMVAIHFHNMENNTMKVNIFRQLFGHQHSSKQEAHTGLEQHEGQI